MAEVLLGRSIGSVTGPDIVTVQVSLDSLGTTAYAIGDVLSAGGTAVRLDCAGRFKSTTIELVGVRLYEHAEAGTCQKPDLSLYLLNADYVVPAQNAAFKGPTVAEGAPSSLQHKLTVPAAGWIDYEPATAPPRHALTSISVGKLLRLGDTRALFLVPVIEVAKTFAADARLLIELDFKR